jgi:hypothetical protein
MNEIENEGVLENLKKMYSDNFVVKNLKKFWPHKDNCEGFFVSEITKKFETENKFKYKKNIVFTPDKTWKILENKQKLQALHTFKNYFQSELPKHLDDFFIVSHDDVLWLQSKIYWQRLKHMPVRIVGLPFYKQFTNQKFDFNPYCAEALLKKTKKFINLNEEEAYEFFDHFEVKGNFADNKISLIKNRPFLLGLGRVSESRIRKI